MTAILFLIGFLVAFMGAVMCLWVLVSGEGSPVAPVLFLGAGLLLMAPGWRDARDQTWR